MKKINMILLILLTITFLSAAVTGADEEISETGSGVFDSEMFTARDMEQSADLGEAVYYTVTDGGEIHITEDGIYVLSGTAANAVIYVNAADEDKVQLVLDDLNITNGNFPCIYVLNADKVFITTASDSCLTVTGTFVSDNETGTDTDAVIFSRTDLVLNGTAALYIRSSDNGITGKDDLKITGGIYDISAAAKCLEANDSICIADGTFILNAGTDAIHAENNGDDSKGHVYIGNGEFEIEAGDDGIHALSCIQIDAGIINITAGEGMEGTFIQINDGTISISSRDDGINAASKSGSYTTSLEINGGDITVVMEAGDTDGLDSNGNLYINGGNINITGSSAVDYDGIGEFNGGTLIVNGQQMSSLPNQMMGGSGGGRNGFGW